MEGYYIDLQIHLCTCIEGSASSPGLSRKRAATTSCKTCGGKQLVNGRGSPPGSMLSTVGLELTSLINSDLTWKKASKGRSASRRARKPVARCSKAGGELVNKDPKRVAMPVSESEKLGVSVLGCRFSEKAEHIPIKKRRFLFRSPSPPSKNSSPRSEETTDDAAAASGTDLGKIVDTELDCDRKNLVKVNEFPGANEDFSGISILAAAACSSSMGGEDGFEEGVSRDGESSAHEGPLDVLVNNELCSLSKGFPMEDLVSSAKVSTEEAGSCSSPVPEKELAASSRTENSLLKCQAHGQNMEGTSFPDSHVTVSQDLLRNKDDETARTHESSLRDDRSHWDLNTAMDAWERPFEYQCCDPQFNVGDSISEDVDDGKTSDKMEKSEGCELERESGGTNGKILLPSDSSGLAQTQELNIEEHGSDSDSGINESICLQEKFVSSSEIINASKTDLPQELESLHNQEIISLDAGSVVSVPVEHDQGLSVCANVDENAPVQSVAFGSTGSGESLSSHQLASLDSCTDNSLSLNSNNLTSICISEGNDLAVSTGIAIVNDRNDCAAKTPKDSTIPSSSQAERQEAAPPHVAFSENSMYDSMDVQKEDAEDPGRKLSLSEGVHVHKGMISLETGEVRTVGDILENAVCKSDEVSFSQSSPTCAEMPSSEALLGGQPVVAEDAKEQHGKVSVDGTDANDTQVHIDTRELTKCSGKSAELLGASSGLSSHSECISASNDLMDHPDKMAGSGYDSDVSQDDPDPVVRIEKASELQMDYDSQYEDGELRESIEYTWEDLGGEDGEGEHVDYGSDNRDMAGFGASDYHVMLVKVEGAECKRQRVSNNKNLGSEPEQSCLGSSSMTKVVEAVSGKDDGAKCSSPCLSTRFSGKDDIDQFDASAEVNKETGARPDNVSGDHEIHVMEADAEEASQDDDLKMKISGWDLLPENCKSSSDIAMELGDGSGRKNISGDSVDGLNTEDTETRMVKSRTFKRELLSRIEGPVSGDVFLGKHRLCTQGSRSNDADDSNSRSERESGSVKSFGRSSYSLHIHSRGRGSEHWADYPDGHRAPRRHHSSGYRSITGFSFPGPENAAAVFTSRQSTSVSSHGVRRALRRSGSPAEGDEAFGMRLGLRPAGEISPDRHMGIAGKGNPCLRHRSRSPSFRSGARVQRIRSPHQRSGFASDHMVGFMSMPRNHGSPPHNSRWIGDRKDGMVHFREHGYKQRSSVLDRRSPGRICPRGERFDLGDSRKLKPNEYYRSMHSGRFSEMDGVARGPRYEGSDDDRKKHGCRYGLMQPGRRYDMDGAVKRFRCDIEDGFVAAHNFRKRDGSDFHARSPKDYTRGNDSRIGDIPRRSREERGPFLCRRDGKYNADSKAFGLHEGDEDLAPRRRRPLVIGIFSGLHFEDMGSSQACTLRTWDLLRLAL
ncbi:hypothetical protein CK203_096030 [Vitis vinifera]|uniref:Uncharacterized protein n=2 Tax=Vitis vinifera TaxID=29760 RepID=A0A438E6F3_VITVI|nr:hypothetical protein CK203_096030 [Vitis vinifera]